MIMWHNDNYIFRGETKRNRLPEKPKPNVDKQGEESRRGKTEAESAQTVVWQFSQKWSSQRQPTPARCINGLHVAC